MGEKRGVISRIIIGGRIKSNNVRRIVGGGGRHRGGGAEDTFREGWVLVNASTVCPNGTNLPGGGGI